MAIYTLRPLTAAQIRRRRRAYVLILVVSLLVLASSIAAWMNLLNPPWLRQTLFAVSILGLLGALGSGMGLWSFDDVIRLRDSRAWEVSPQGVRSYSARLGEPEPLRLGLSAPDDAPTRSGGQTWFLPLARTRDFEMGPSGAILVHGGFGNGSIRIPADVDDAEGLRRELLALGMRETRHSRPAWYARLTAKWIGVLLLLLATSYVFWGTSFWGVLASGALYTGFMAWGTRAAHRLREGRTLRQSLLAFAFVPFVLLIAGQRAWDISHGRVGRTGHGSVWSSRR